MKFSLAALATLALAAGVQAQINASHVESACTDACSPFITLYNDECSAELSSGDDATAQKGIDCLCSTSTANKLLACSGCVSNSTQGHLLVDTWNAACPVYANQTAITYVAGTATASSSAADATATSKDSAAGNQAVAGGLGLLLAGGLALLA